MGVVENLRKLSSLKDISQITVNDHFGEPVANDRQIRFYEFALMFEEALGGGHRRMILAPINPSRIIHRI